MGEQEHHLKLGDATEQWLAAFGVTKERYCEAKRLFGLIPECAVATPAVSGSTALATGGGINERESAPRQSSP